jgi:hypothetical protein
MRPDDPRLSDPKWLASVMTEPLSVGAVPEHFVPMRAWAAEPCPGEEFLRDPKRSGVCVVRMVPLSHLGDAMKRAVLEARQDGKRGDDAIIEPV